MRELLGVRVIPWCGFIFQEYHLNWPFVSRVSYEQRGSLVDFLIFLIAPSFWLFLTTFKIVHLVLIFVVKLDVVFVLSISLEPSNRFNRELWAEGVIAWFDFNFFIARSSRSFLMTFGMFHLVLILVVKYDVFVVLVFSLEWSTRFKRELWPEGVIAWFDFSFLMIRESLTWIAHSFQELYTRALGAPSFRSFLWELSAIWNEPWVFLTSSMYLSGGGDWSGSGMLIYFCWN